MILVKSDCSHGRYQEEGPLFDFGFGVGALRLSDLHLSLELTFVLRVEDPPNRKFIGLIQFVWNVFGGRLGTHAGSSSNGGQVLRKL